MCSASLYAGTMAVTVPEGSSVIGAPAQVEEIRFYVGKTHSAGKFPANSHNGSLIATRWGDAGVTEGHPRPPIRARDVAHVTRPVAKGGVHGPICDLCPKAAPRR